MKKEPVNGLRDWIDNKPIYSYFLHENIRYERVFIDVYEKLDFQIIPISFDTTFFGMLYDGNKVSINQNIESSDGSFYAPYFECFSKDDLINKIALFVSKFVTEVNSQIRVYVYRFIDSNEKRFFAIGGTNFFPKSEIIHKLQIKTIFNENVPPVNESLWDVVSKEMETLSENPDCFVLEKQEVLDFEERTFPIPESCRDVLIVNDPSSGFNATHTHGKTTEMYHDPKHYQYGSIFTLSSFILNSEQDFNNKIAWAANAFREITGLPSIKVVGLYSKQENERLKASILVYQNEASLKKDESEEDEAF